MCGEFTKRAGLPPGPYGTGLPGEGGARVETRSSPILSVGFARSIPKQRVFDVEGFSEDL